jgi:hypothetical protein
MAFSDDLLNINTTSDDFHFQLFLNEFRVPYIPVVPRNDSQYPVGLTVFTFFNEEYLKTVIERDFDGYQVYLHDPFELPSDNSIKYLMKLDRKLEIKINPQINSIDNSIVNYNPKE